MTAHSRRMLPWLIVVLLAAGQSPAAAYQQTARPGQSTDVHPSTAAPEHSSKPLESLLQADGTLNLQTGFSGSLDPTGWTMISGVGEPPHFARADGSDGGDTPAVPGDEFWDNRFNVLGVSGYVRAVAVSGNDVYVGGLFSAVGSLAANNIARWNSATGVWSTLGSGVSSYVYALAVSGDDLYVGGLFNAAGGVPANNIARWNSTTGMWSALGGGVDGTVLSIAVSGSDVYVGGYFFAAGGSLSVPYTQGIALWTSTTSTWSALGTGVPGYVYAIAVSGGDVYAGGLFNAAGGVTASNIAKWNSVTNTWSALGSGVNGTGYKVFALAVSGDELYVGGLFNTAGGVPNTLNIARWNSLTNTWSALGNGVSSYVYALTVIGSDVYVGGLFSAASNVPNTRSIARWNGASWSAVGSGVSGYVYALAPGADGLYAGGLFNAAGGKSSRNFGLWHGSVAIPANPDDVYWDSRFGGEGSVNGWVCAVAVNGSDVYVGGSFTMAGGVPASRIAKWNSVSNTWSALGSGITEPGSGCAVSGIAISGSDVYVGGAFSSAGGVPGTRHIAKWNGTNWSALGGGIAGSGVAAVAASGGIVYMAGFFPSVNKVVNPVFPEDYLTVNNVAGWNGAWFALGSGSNVGVNSRVWTVEMSGDNVYVGGGFTMAGGAPASYIARWDGTNWSALGSGVGNPVGNFYPVNGIAVVGNDAYVVGTFTTAGGAPASRIARWNNTTETWSPLGSGLNSDGLAVAPGPSGVYVGGVFSTAGGKPSNFFGLWHTAFPHVGSISGQVIHDSTGVSGARVQACRTGGGSCFWRGITDSQGNYRAVGLPDGQYRVTAYPPASSSLLPGSTGPLNIVNGGALFGQNIFLQASQPVPPGTSISPVEGMQGGIPSLHWKKQLQLVTNGCPGGVASYQILQNGVVIRSGPMMESPPPPGRYQGVIDPLHPNNGYATIRITIQCPDNSTQTIDFSIYIDPSGIVRTVHGLPVEGATVILYYFDDVQGEFVIVPNGDAIMSPANRANPDLTNAEGHFGWDVIAGFYKVRAEKAGCVSPGNPDQLYVESEILVVPPPATDLDLRLDCPENLIYLPLIWR